MRRAQAPGERFRRGRRVGAGQAMAQASDGNGLGVPGKWLACTHPVAHRGLRIVGARVTFVGQKDTAFVADVNTISAQSGKWTLERNHLFLPGLQAKQRMYIFECVPARSQPPLSPAGVTSRRATIWRGPPPSASSPIDVKKLCGKKRTSACAVCDAFVNPLFSRGASGPGFGSHNRDRVKRYSGHASTGQSYWPPAGHASVRQKLTSITNTAEVSQS